LKYPMMMSKMLATIELTTPSTKPIAVWSSLSCQFSKAHTVRKSGQCSDIGYIYMRTLTAVLRRGTQYLQPAGPSESHHSQHHRVTSEYGEVQGETSTFHTGWTSRWALRKADAEVFKMWCCLMRKVRRPQLLPSVSVRTNGWRQTCPAGSLRISQTRHWPA
jgi:hypothetical protein